MSELSRTTGVPVATIKFYLREGLVPAGIRTAVNQATYDESHIERLVLIRALVEVAGLPIAAVRSVLAAASDPAGSVHSVLTMIQDAHTSPTRSRDGAAWADAREEIADLIHTLRWRVRPQSPALDQLTDILLALRTLSPELASADAETCFGLPARLAADLADADLDSIGSSAAGNGTDNLVEAAVVRTVLGGRAFDALRHLALEDASTRAFGPTPDAHRSGPNK
jgi:DNA-binding transcriptional MerR regulator